MSSVTVEAMLESFLNNPVNKIKREREQTYKSLRFLELELLQNTSLVIAELGGDNHRYLGFVFSKDKYQQITENNFVPHPNLGPIPNFLDSLT